MVTRASDYFKNKATETGILEDDIEITGTETGYGLDLLIITPDQLKALQSGKLLGVDIQGGEYGLYIKLDDTTREKQ